ncbi:MAG: S16 family serine protease [Candidatus Nanopelagicales bacterium]
MIATRSTPMPSTSPTRAPARATRTRRRWVAVMAAGTLALAGAACSPQRVEPSASTSGGQTVPFHPLYFSGAAPNATGGVSDADVTFQRGGDVLRVEFSEDQVEGVGDQIRAASWSAVTVASLLTGAPVTGTYRFTYTGYADGPSAGTLTTVAVLAAQRGITIDPKATMTGTINPDGTVGPVGGIPQKLQGAADNGFTTVLVPAGQRNDVDANTGNLVDLVELGKTLGVEVAEVANVYEAYSTLTGQTLPRSTGSGSDRLDDEVYAKFKAQTGLALSRYGEDESRFLNLPDAIQEALIDSALEAQGNAQRAQDLSDQGLQAGAFEAAWLGAAEMHAVVATGQALIDVVNGDLAATVNRVTGAQSAETDMYALLDSLATYDPANISDAAALAFAYGQALDSYTLSVFAENQLAGISDAYDQGQIGDQEALTQLLVPLLYFEFAGSMVDYGRSVFEVGRDLAGPAISDNVDLEGVADFFRKGADANWAAFNDVVIHSIAVQYEASDERVVTALADSDLEIAISLTQQQAIDGLKQYIGAGEPNAAYAQLGYAIGNYARNALLLYKYYSNGELDEDFQLTGVKSERAFNASLDLGQEQLSSIVKVLQEKGAQPAYQAALLESADIDRNGDVDDKFEALRYYWAGFVSGRVMAYLGGFAGSGFAD